MEKTLFSLVILGVGCIVIAGWAWAAVLGDSQDELNSDFQTLKERYRK